MRPSLAAHFSSQAAAIAGPGFALLRDPRGVGDAACGPEPVARSALLSAVHDAEHALGVDAQLAVVLSTAPLGCASIYYVPIANDVLGIGYAHTEGQEVFDRGGQSALEGIVFLNDWPYWREHPRELESAFNHEVGHRWGARVHARIEGQPSAALLGRQHAHWSYFLSSEGSALEGNVWRAAPGGFESATPEYPTQFSDLDLYLMGVLRAAEVRPLELLVEPRASEPDCTGAPPIAESPPQTCGPQRLEARAVTVTIDDVIAVEGERSPAAQSSATLNVLVLVFAPDAVALTSGDCAELSRALDAARADFAAATRGRLRLEDVLARREPDRPGVDVRDAGAADVDEELTARCAGLLAELGAVPSTSPSPSLQGPESACHLARRRHAPTRALGVLVVIGAALVRRRAMRRDAARCGASGLRRRS